MDKKMHDSGERREFGTGAVRDAAKGKPRLDLISPVAMRRMGTHLGVAALAKEDGGKGYGERNWEKGMPLGTIIASLKRHIDEYLEGGRSEDHPAAILCNAMFLAHTEEMIEKGLLPPELDDLPDYTKKVKETVEPVSFWEIVGAVLNKLPDDNNPKPTCNTVPANRVCIECDKVYSDTGRECCPACLHEVEVEVVPDKPTRIVTSTGGSLDPFNPDLKDINIEDIFKGLSSNCRYAGQLKRGIEFYSVAQHSVMMALWAEADGHSIEVCLFLLLHDFSEAYISDISSPVKQKLTQYLELEATLMEAIYTKFMDEQPSESAHKMIKYYDKLIGTQEIRYLMVPSPIFNPWIKNVPVVPVPHFIIEGVANPWNIARSYKELRLLFDRYMRYLCDSGNEQLIG